MKVAAELRLKHGALYLAVQKAGGTKALAALIGIGHQTVHQWLFMRKAPTPGVYTKWYTKEVESRLEQATAQKAADLFPRELREATEFFRKNRQRVEIRDVSPAAIEQLTSQYLERSTTPDPAETVADRELTDRVREVIKTLPVRERRMVEMYYGIGGGERFTYAEPSNLFGVTPTRCMQIVAHAIRMLQNPSRASQLVDFTEEGYPDWTRIDREITESQERSLRERIEGSVF
jgi:RNA polymerase sigma factor (sigma-70 family)